MLKWIGAVLILITVVLFFWDQHARCRKPTIYYVENLPCGWRGMTIPPFGIFIRNDYKNCQWILNHENVHWQQYQDLKLVPFYYNYFSQYIKYGYDKMPMEIEARFEETDYCKVHYLECYHNKK